MLSVWTKTAGGAPKWTWSCIVAVAALAGPAIAAAAAVTSAEAPRTAVTFAPATPKRAGHLIRSPRLGTGMRYSVPAGARALQIIVRKFGWPPSRKLVRRAASRLRRAPVRRSRQRATARTGTAGSAPGPDAVLRP